MTTVVSLMTMADPYWTTWTRRFAIVGILVGQVMQGDTAEALCKALYAHSEVRELGSDFHPFAAHAESAGHVQHGCGCLFGCHGGVGSRCWAARRPARLAGGGPGGCRAGLR